VYYRNGTTAASISTLGLGAAAGTGYNVRLRDDILLYQDSSGWDLIRVNSGETAKLVARKEPIALAVPVPLPNGRVALLELSERLTIRYADTSKGIVITEDDSF